MTSLVGQFWLLESVLWLTFAGVMWQQKKSLIPTDLTALTKALWTIQAAKFLGNRETIMWELKLLNILVYLTLVYFDEDQEAGEDFV